MNSPAPPPGNPTPRLLFIATDPSRASELEREFSDLAPAPFAFSLAPTVEAALEVCSREPITAVLLVLDVDGGSEGLRAIDRFVRVRANPPLIVVLPVADEALALECLARGADEVMASDERTPAALLRAVRAAGARRTFQQPAAVPVDEYRRAEQTLRMRESHAQALLRLSRRLEHAESHTGILAATREAIEATIGLRRVWLYQLSTDGEYLELVLEDEGGDPLEQQGEGRKLRVAGDLMLEEIVAAEEVVVVEDAQTDPRTDKEIVAALGNRTIVNVPIFLAGQRLGALGTGSFGSEGVRRLSAEEREFLAAVGSHVAGVLDRVTAASHRLRAEASLRLFRTLVDQSEDAFEIIDPETGQFLDVNDRGCLDLGYSREELLRLTVFDIDPTVKRSTWPGWMDVLRRRGRVTVQGVHVRKDGTTFPVEVNVGRVEADREYLISVARDVSERKRLEEQVRQSQKMEAIGQLAAGVAHDFNNLLCVIAGYAELCQMGISSDQAEWKMLDEIKTAGDRATSLTRQLLAFSRQQVLAPRVLDLNDIVADVRSMLSRLIGEDILLTTILGPALHMVKVDPGQVSQVLMNLVVNARDAMPGGGHLTIETRNVPRPPDGTSTTADPQAAVLLSVADTGSGMTEAVRARIFDPFFTTKEVGSGTGLGLAVVHGIVEQSGGSVEVETELGQGTTFRIYLPAVPDLPRELPPSQKVIPAGGTETLLLVEDDDLVRQFTADALRPFGYTLLKASNGDEALRLAADHVGVIHLLLTDVVMPRMNGRQLAEELQVFRPDLKVLFVSGYTDDAVVRRGVHQSEVAFLQKPVSPSLLAARVRELLDRPQPLKS